MGVRFLERGALAAATSAMVVPKRLAMPESLWLTCGASEVEGGVSNREAREETADGGGDLDGDSKAEVGPLRRFCCDIVGWWEESDYCFWMCRNGGQQASEEI